VQMYGLIRTHADCGTPPNRTIADILERGRARARHTHGRGSAAMNLGHHVRDIQRLAASLRVCGAHFRCGVH
jgi:hypothetical protein